MGVLDWTNEYLNPFAESNREREVREFEERQQARNRSRMMSPSDFARHNPVDAMTGESVPEQMMRNAPYGTRSANSPMGRGPNGPSDLDAWDPNKIFSIGGGAVPPGGGKAGGADDFTRTRRTAADESTRGDARESLRAAMTDLLGRKPNSREVRRFQRRLNELERSNPTVQVSSQDSSGETVLQTVDQEGGISANDVTAFARDEVNNEFAEERSRYGIMDYMSAFENVIGGR